MSPALAFALGAVASGPAWLWLAYRFVRWGMNHDGDRFRRSHAR